MADLTPTAVSGSSDFNSGTGHDETREVLSDLLANRTETYSLLTSLRRQQYGASAPANPNTGDLWRCSTTAGLYTADTTYRWSGTAWVEETSSSINTTARNVVIQGAVTTAGATALFTGSTAALTVQLNATATPMVVTWMDGNDGTSGKVDIVGTVTADSTTFWSSLPQNSTVYLYVDFDGTSTISGGFSTVSPVYQDYAPSVTATGTHWIDDNLGQVLVTNGSAWTKEYRVFVGTATTDTTKVTAVSIYPYNVLRTNITGTASLDIPLTYLDTDDTLAADSDSKIATQKATKAYVDANAGSSRLITIILDKKSQNTVGQTLASGAWRTRELNTYQVNQIGLAALSSNQFVLPAGTYYVSIQAGANSTDRNQIILYNTTDAATEIGPSVNELAAASTAGSAGPFLAGVFTITASKTYEIRHYVNGTAISGYACNFTDEIYLICVIEKVA